MGVFVSLMISLRVSGTCALGTITVCMCSLGNSTDHWGLLWRFVREPSAPVPAAISLAPCGAQVPSQLQCLLLLQLLPRSQTRGWDQCHQQEGRGASGLAGSWSTSGGTDGQIQLSGVASLADVGLNISSLCSFVSLW